MCVEGGQTLCPAMWHDASHSITLLLSFSLHPFPVFLFSIQQLSYCYILMENRVVRGAWLSEGSVCLQNFLCLCVCVCERERERERERESAVQCIVLVSFVSEVLSGMKWDEDLRRVCHFLWVWVCLCVVCEYICVCIKVCVCVCVSVASSLGRR